MEPDLLVVTGAREHNLKGVSVRLPKNRLILFTGVSGSGKSSLAFDTLYAEGQRRFVESLSAYARQFLGRMERPRYETIRGLAPTIAIEQRTSSANPRSTVATTTEIADYLRVLWARAGTPHCPKDGNRVERQSAESIVRRLLALPEGAAITLLAPLVVARKGEHRELLEDARKQAFVRARIDGKLVRLEPLPELAPKQKHTIELAVDRLTLRSGIESRLTDSVETALRAGQGVVVVAVDGHNDERMSEKAACPDCGLSLPEMSPQLFSWNAPQGMCPACQGLGSRMEVDPARLVPDPELSIAEGAIALFSGPAMAAGLQKILLDEVLRAHDIDADRPFHQLSPGKQKILMHGTGDKELKVRLESKKFSTDWTTTWKGLVPLVEKKLKETQSEGMRHFLLRFFSSSPCEDCAGSRLNPFARAARVGTHTLPEVLRMPVGEALGVFERLELGGNKAEVGAEILREVRSRLRFLVDVGLDYLTLDRAGPTLSGGEAQRIRLASQVGSELTGVLYVLDEPSIGLHPRDTARLLGTLTRLRDLGNTVLVVEHDQDAIRAADWVVDFGPGAGVQGGEVVAEGPPATLGDQPRSLTGAYLCGREQIAIPARRRAAKKELVLRGPSLHNLKGEDVAFPIGTLIAVTGVSGAGKSSLIVGTLEPLLAQKLHGQNRKPGPYRALEGLHLIDKVVAIDQKPIGLTPRSNPATYVKAFDEIRDVFSQLPEARAFGFARGRFSFNVKGGRCESCAGDGVMRVEMHFLPDVYVTCEACAGSRFNDATLRVRFKGKNIAEVLALTVDEALETFSGLPRVERPLRTLADVGLGYLELGQASTTLSGGEAQRVKLSRELARSDTGRTFYILDEPTTGLHFEDVRRLLAVLARLIDAGNTVVVIEHNLEVLKCADHIVDLGPEGGERGGRVVATGTPEAIAANRDSHTGTWLRQVLR